MKKSILILTLVLLFICGVVRAAELADLEGLVQEGGRITGSMDIDKDYALQVDMSLPKAVEGSIRQYKMQQIQISESEIRALLNGRTQPAQPGETWEIWTLDRTEYRQFIYQEESLTYAAFYPPSASLPLEEEDPMLVLANQQAQSLLEAWGIPHEYPFYQVCNAAQGADVSLRGTQFRTGSDMEKYLLGINNEVAQYEYEYRKKLKMYDDEYAFVCVRQRLDDIPFAISDIKSRYYRPDNPQFDEGIYLLLQYNSQGEIVYGTASNLHIMAEEMGDSPPVLDWQVCLTSLSRDNTFFEGLLEAKVIDAELCYAINEKHITYPVWQFMVEFRQYADSSLQEYLCFPVYVDAYSGKTL